MSTDDTAPPRGTGLSFRLGRIPVLMPWSSFLGIGVIAFLWLDSFRLDGSDPRRTLVLAAVFAVLFYVCILGHELAHAYVARAAGYPVRSITLWALGGYTSYERARSSAWREGLIALSGPVSSVLIGVACNLAAYSSLGEDPTAFAVLHALGFSNIVLGIYNALPGLPLDGGAVLKAVIWGASGNERRATVIAAWSGLVTALVVFAVPQWLRARAGLAPDLQSIVFGLLISGYLAQGAWATLKQADVTARVPGLTTQRLARAAVVVAADTPLAEALRRRDEGRAGAMVVVDADGRPRAIAQDVAVEAVPVERRPWVPVSSVSAALDPRAVLPADLHGEALLQAMIAFSAPYYLVVDAGGTWSGVLATSDVEAALAGHR
jgi:Zn-dependent protease/CBS domain-containing protein